jgi:hypothetical protein
MEISVRGTLKRGKKTTLMVTVTDFETAAGVSGAKVRAAGAGVRKRAARTNLFGGIRLVVRPKSRGTLVISAAKSGYQPTSARIAVR